jgi:hypothetical protein
MTLPRYTPIKRRSPMRRKAGKRRREQKPITDLCRGEPCYIRLNTVCNSTPENSVPAHLRLAGITGMGVIAPAFMACPACPQCHDAVDRRRFMDLDRDYVQQAHQEAIFRWQKVLWDRGIIYMGEPE